MTWWSAFTVRPFAPVVVSITAWAVIIAVVVLVGRASPPGMQELLWIATGSTTGVTVRALYRTWRARRHLRRDATASPDTRTD